MQSSLKKFKLLLIGVLPPPVGGVATIYQTLLNSSLKDSFDLKFLDIRGSAGPRALRNLGRFSISKAVKSAYHLIRLVWIMLTWRPQVVYLSFNSVRWAGYRDSLFVRVIKSLGAKIVVRFENCTFADYYRSGSRRRKRRIEKTFKLVDSIHVGNPDMKRCVVDVVQRDGIFTIPSGLDGRPLLEIAEARECRRPTRKILFLGWLMSKKGVLELIEAFDRIAATEPQCELTLAGPWVGRDKPKVMERINKSKFKSRIHLPGVVEGEAKLALFREADILILPTHLKEGCSNAIIEASAAGLPIITCKMGGITSIFSHGEGGFFVPVGGIDEIVEHIETLFHDAALYKRFSRSNVGRFKEMFTKEKFIESVRKSILKVCQGDRGLPKSNSEDIQ